MACGAIHEDTLLTCCQLPAASTPLIYRSFLLLLPPPSSSSSNTSPDAIRYLTCRGLCCQPASQWPALPSSSLIEHVPSGIRHQALHLSWPALPAREGSLLPAFLQVPCSRCLTRQRRRKGGRTENATVSGSNQVGPVLPKRPVLSVPGACDAPMPSSLAGLGGLARERRAALHSIFDDPIARAPRRPGPVRRQRV